MRPTLSTRWRKAPRESPEPPTIKFRSDWSHLLSGPIQPGGQVLIVYDPARLPACRQVASGQSAREIVAHSCAYSFGEVVCCDVHEAVAPTGADRNTSSEPWHFDVTIPAAAERIELWFQNRDCLPAGVWDSCYGENFRFDVSRSTLKTLPAWIVSRWWRGLVALIVLLATIVSGGWLILEWPNRLAGILGVVAVLTSIGAALWLVPQCQLVSWRGKIEAKDSLEAETTARATLAQIVTGLAVFAGLAFTWQGLANTSRTTEQTLTISNEQLELSQTGQNAERFSRAIEQLGSTQPQVRLGGIYGLEQTASSSPTDAVTVMDILVAFVRESAPLDSPIAATPGANIATAARAGPEVDVQAALTVIGRLKVPDEAERRCYDLTRTDLHGANLAGADLTHLCLVGTDLSDASLVGADLTRVDLSGSNLTRANLNRAILTDATLGGANLTGALLGGANLAKAKLGRAILVGALLGCIETADDLICSDLSGAVMTRADLTGAELRGSTVAGANFGRAILTGADLRGVDLREALGLTQQQIDSAMTDTQTKLPGSLSASPAASFIST